MRLWASLPADQWIPEEEAFSLILRAADRYQGDGAWASLMVQTLAGMGAVQVRNGSVRRSDDYPSLPDLIIGSDAYNALLERENKEAREREIENDNRTARQNFEQSPQGRQQRELLELVDERVNAILDDRVEALVEKHFDEMRSELEPTALKGLRAKWDAATGGAEDEQGA
jgi:hypothetical protein